MAYYRLYFFNGRSGHIDRFAELDASDDDHAIRLAGAQDGGESMELWCEGRMVCRFEAPEPAASMPAPNAST